MNLSIQVVTLHSLAKLENRTPNSSGCGQAMNSADLMSGSSCFLLMSGLLGQCAGERASQRGPLHHKEFSVRAAGMIPLEMRSAGFK